MVNRKIENFEKLIAASSVEEDDVDGVFRTNNVMTSVSGKRIKDAFQQMTEIKRPQARHSRTVSLTEPSKNDNRNTLPRITRTRFNKCSSRRLASHNNDSNDPEPKAKENREKLKENSRDHSECAFRRNYSESSFLPLESSMRKLTKTNVGRKNCIDYSRAQSQTEDDNEKVNVEELIEKLREKSRALRKNSMEMTLNKNSNEHSTQKSSTTRRVSFNDVITNIDALPNHCKITEKNSDSHVDEKSLRDTGKGSDSSVAVEHQLNRSNSKRKVSFREIDEYQKSLSIPEEDEFGLNEFDVEDKDNFVVETYHDEDRYLIYTYYLISHKVASEDTKEEEILEMSKDCDLTVRLNVDTPSERTSENLMQKQYSSPAIELFAENGIDVAWTFEISKKSPTSSEESIDKAGNSAEHTDDEDMSSDNYYSVSHNIPSNCVFEKDLYDANGNVRVQTRITGSPRVEITSKKRDLPPLPSPQSGSRDETKKMAYIIDELITTEVKYVEGLRIVVRDYREYMYQNSPKHVIGKEGYLFGNISQIYKQAENFLSCLKAIPPHPEHIAALFLKWKHMFDLYPQYSKNKPTADLYLKEFEPQIKERQRVLRDKLDLHSYLLTPIQRLGKYVLILENMEKDILKNSKDVNPPDIINDAIQMIKSVMRRGNDIIAVDSIEKCKLDLTLQGSFIMREKFSVSKNRKKYEMMVFLFEKIIVFTQQNQKNLEKFNHVESIYLNDLSIACFEEDQLMFKLFDHPKTKRGNYDEHAYVLTARSEKVKNLWTSTITAKLWDQLEHAKILQKQLHDDQGRRYSTNEIHITSGDPARKSIFYIEAVPTVQENKDNQ